MIAAPFLAMVQGQGHMTVKFLNEFNNDYVYIYLQHLHYYVDFMVKTLLRFSVWIHN